MNGDRFGFEETPYTLLILADLIYNGMLMTILLSTCKHFKELYDC